MITSEGAPAMLTVMLADEGVVGVVGAVGVVGVVGVVGFVGVVGVVGVVGEPDDVAPTVAVTVALVAVRSVVDAAPFASVVTTVASSVPAVVENETGAAVSGLPLMSNTLTEIADEPPSAGMSVGFALIATRPTAAVPTATFTALAPDALAPPEFAVIVASPLAVPALNVVTARPLMSVSTLAGWIVPSVVVNVTRVPECGGVPLASSSCALSCTVPFTGTAVDDAVSVITEPDGASSGTF